MNDFKTNNQNLILNLDVNTKSPIFGKNVWNFFTHKNSKYQIEARKHEEFKLSFKKYQTNPVDFFKEQLKNEPLTTARIDYLNLLKNNNLIVAKVPRNIGTSYFINEISAWFYSCFIDSKVFLTTGLPVSNLEFLYNIQDDLVKEYQNIYSYSTNRKFSISSSSLNYMHYMTIPISGSKYEREAKYGGKFGKDLLFIFDMANAVPEEILQVMGIYEQFKSSNIKVLYFYNEGQASLEANNKLKDLTKDYIKFDFCEY